MGTSPKKKKKRNSKVSKCMLEAIDKVGGDGGNDPFVIIYTELKNSSFSCKTCIVILLQRHGTFISHNSFSNVK